jgi:hypothetical protein
MKQYVFPQTLSPDQNFNRMGGLTKRELFAIICLLIAFPDSTGITDASQQAWAMADAFIEAGKDLPYKGEGE